MINIINISPVLATFGKGGINMINVINISLVLANFVSSAIQNQTSLLERGGWRGQKSKTTPKKGNFGVQIFEVNSAQKLMP